MQAIVTLQTIAAENAVFCGTGGVSEANRGEGFRPAFRDDATARVYLSRFANGAPAPFHLLDGLPDEVVTARAAGGRVLEAKPGLVSGFVRGERFFTRDEAARELARYDA